MNKETLSFVNESELDMHKKLENNSLYNFLRTQENTPFSKEITPKIVLEMIDIYDFSIINGHPEILDHLEKIYLHFGIDGEILQELSAVKHDYIDVALLNKCGCTEESIIEAFTKHVFRRIY